MTDGTKYFRVRNAIGVFIQLPEIYGRKVKTKKKNCPSDKALQNIILKIPQFLIKDFPIIIIKGNEDYPTLAEGLKRLSKALHRLKNHQDKPIKSLSHIGAFSLGLAGDLKILNILEGIKPCNSTHYCILCTTKDGPTIDEIDGNITAI